MSDLNIDRINAEASDTELDHLAEMASKIIFYGMPAPKDKPYWTDAYCVEDKGTFTFLGIIGRLGTSQIYEYDDMFTTAGKGRAKSLPGAIMKLVEAAQVTTDLHE